MKREGKPRKGEASREKEARRIAKSLVSQLPDDRGDEETVEECSSWRGASGTGRAGGIRRRSNFFVTGSSESTLA